MRSWLEAWVLPSGRGTIGAGSPDARLGGDPLGALAGEQEYRVGSSEESRVRLIPRGAVEASATQNKGKKGRFFPKGREGRGAPRRSEQAQVSPQMSAC